MKISKIVLGLVLIAAAVLLILEALGIILPITGMVGEIGFWQAVGGIFLICGIGSLLMSGKFWEIFVPLGFLFMIFEKNIAFICGIENENFINNWLVFGCSLLLSAGFMFIFPGRKKKKKKDKKSKSGVFVHVKDNEFGAAVAYIDCEEFGNTVMEHSVKNKFGALEVRFDNVECYKGEATLYVENRLGALDICIPKSWKVVDKIDVRLGVIDLDDAEEQDGPTLILDGEVSLGAIDIERI